MAFKMRGFSAFNMNGNTDGQDIEPTKKQERKSKRQRNKYNKEALKNTSVSREKLLEENVRLKTELSTYRKNKLVELVKDIPEQSIDFVFDRITLMTSINNIGVEEEEQRVNQEC